MRLVLALFFSLTVSAALAQNPTCPTRPAGTAGNACASVDYVAQNAAAGFLVTAPPFNAVCDGVTDDAAAINAAITAASVSTVSKIVYIPDRTCKVNSNVNLGNGTSSTASTYQGVIIRGLGNPNTAPIFPGFVATNGPKLLWGGSGAGGVIAVNGPIQGWAVENLYIDCASTAASVGLNVISAMNGEVKNISFINCFRGRISQTVAPFGSFTNTNSQHNKYYNITYQVPSIAGATGALVTGITSADTDYETNIGADIFLPTSVVSVCGVTLQGTESGTWVGVHHYGGNASATSWCLDYSVNSGGWPASTTIVNPDPFQSGGGAQWANVGTPGAAAKPNYIVSLGQTNSATCPNITNLFCLESNRILFSPGGNTANFSFFPPPALTTFTPSPSCGTATFTTNSARFYSIGKITFFNLDFNFTALGTCTSALTFTLPTTPVVNQGFAGNNSGSGFSPGCRIASGSTTATCNNGVGTNFGGSDRLFFSATYENQ